jgi:uncharacterized protein YeaO (DUF488 family)
MIRIRRIYDPPSVDDGRRVLVDRLWPRGLSRTSAGIDEWLKEIAPSDGLRRWFGHDPSRWEEFRKRYRDELAGRGEILERLRSEAQEGNLTLLYAAKDLVHNNAVVVKEMLDHW